MILVCHIVVLVAILFVGIVMGSQNEGGAIFAVLAAAFLIVVVGYSVGSSIIEVARFWVSRGLN
jgi:uncharacterized membrane protein YciS (DUF1049 family)